jgi:pimeloyl-ACP methyl ester carboxylesterase
MDRQPDRHVVIVVGGGIAARFAVTYPDQVAALLIIDSASALGLPLSAAMRENTIELAETQGMAAVADYVITANPNLRTQAEASPEARHRLRHPLVRSVCQASHRR